MYGFGLARKQRIYYEPVMSLCQFHSIDKMVAPHIITERHSENVEVRQCANFPLRLCVVKHDPHRGPDFVHVRARYSERLGMHMCVGTMLDGVEGIQASLKMTVSGSDACFGVFSNDFAEVRMMLDMWDLITLRMVGSSDRCCKT